MIRYRARKRERDRERERERKKKKGRERKEKEERNRFYYFAVGEKKKRKGKTSGITNCKQSVQRKVVGNGSTIRDSGCLFFSFELCRYYTVLYLPYMGIERASA